MGLLFEAIKCNKAMSQIMGGHGLDSQGKKKEGLDNIEKKKNLCGTMN